MSKEENELPAGFKELLATLEKLGAKVEVIKVESPSQQTSKTEKFSLTKQIGEEFIQKVISATEENAEMTEGDFLAMFTSPQTILFSTMLAVDHFEEAKAFIKDMRKVIDVLQKQLDEKLPKTNEDAKTETASTPSERLNAQGINGLAKAIYNDNKAKGFWDKPRNVGELLMLMTSELGEALEAHRKDKQDEHLPHRKGLEVELADCLIRILDASAGLGLDIGGAVIEKLAYNRTRAHKHGKQY